MYKGQLEGFPTEIVEMMLDKQVEQGNKRDTKPFETDRFVMKNSKGFDWVLTEEGNDFWRKIITSKKFDVFFDKYPKQKELPKVFCILRDAYNPLWNKYIAWLNNKANDNAAGSINAYYGLKDTGFLHFYYNVNDFRTDVQVLTLEQWNDIINPTQNKTTNMNKEIIGYKLIKSEYKDIALRLCNTIANWENSLQDYDICINQNNYINKLKDAGVLNIWFEPIYKEEFKIGDWVTTTEIAHRCYLPNAGETFQITKVNTEHVYYKDGTSGANAVQKTRIRLATKEEIAKASEIMFTLSNGKTVKIQKDGIIVENVLITLQALQTLYGISDILSGTLWTIVPKVFDIGCYKNVTKEDIENIIKEINKLN